MRNAELGTYNGKTTYCPDYEDGSCPYCDKEGICHIDDPFEDCDDWFSGVYAADWDEWLGLEE